jgi:hypothetical protein
MLAVAVRRSTGLGLGRRTIPRRPWHPTGSNRSHLNPQRPFHATRGQVLSDPPVEVHRRGRDKCHKGERRPRRITRQPEGRALVYRDTTTDGIAPPDSDEVSDVASGNQRPWRCCYLQGCHIGRLSGKSRPKDVVRARPDERPSRPTAGGRPLADGPSGRPPGGWPKRTTSPAAEHTATLQKNSQEHHNIL